MADGEVRGSVPEGLRQCPVGPAGAGDCFRFYNWLRPHQALGYRTPAEVFHGEQDVVDWESNGRKCSPEQGIESLAGATGLSLDSALTLFK